MGNKEENIQKAINYLSLHGEVLKVSPLFVTAPVGYANQDDFLNAACEFKSDLNAQELLETLESMMKEMGRVRTIKNGPRPIDIDILLFNNEIINEPNLIVPHPKMEERLFVIEPLFTIAPDVVHPLTNKSIREYYQELTS